MKKLLQSLAVIAALCLPACAQTAPTAPTWYTIVPLQALTLNVTLPPGTTYRFLSSNGKATIPVTTTATVTLSSWDDGLNGHPPDPDAGIPKVMQVQQASAAFTVSLIDSSVNPASTTVSQVSALGAAAPTTYAITCTASATLAVGAPMPTTLPLTGSKCAAVKK